MVHPFEEKAREVADVTRDLERQDLPPPVKQQLVGAGVAAEDQLAISRMIAKAHEVLVRTKGSDPGGRTPDCLLLLRRKPAELAKMTDKRDGHRCFSFQSPGRRLSAPFQRFLARPYANGCSVMDEDE